MKKTTIAIFLFALMASAALALPPSSVKLTNEGQSTDLSNDVKTVTPYTPPTPSPVYGHGGGSKCGYIHSPCSIESRKAEALRLAQARPTITKLYGYQCFVEYGVCFKIV